MGKKSAQSTKDHGWKAVQSRIKRGKKIKLALIVLGAVVGLVILGQIVNLTKIIISPWKVDGIKRQYLWDGNYNINLVIKTDSISVLIFNPSQKKVTLMKLSENTFLEVPQGFGRWQLSSIYGLGGANLLKDSLMSFLGIPIDGFVEFQKPLNQRSVTELVSKNPLTILTILPYIRTDLTPWELVRLKFALSQVRFDKIKNLDLLTLGVLDKMKLADGTEVVIADPVKLDSVLSDFSDPKLEKEHASIAVFNATSYPLLAQKAARIITNLGGNVIGTHNTEDKLDKTYIVGEKSDTLKRLSQIFGLSCGEAPKCDKIKGLNLGLESSRAQINLMVGEDFYQKFGNR